MNFDFLNNNWHLLFSAIVNTLIITFTSITLGIILGFILALMKLSKIKVLKYIGWFYTWIVRGTPLLLQLLFWYVALPKFGGNYRELLIAIFALIINEGAYSSEIIRAGIKSIDRGQYEAAKVLGISNYYFYIYILIPQTLKKILPSLGNEFITILKDSSLASSISVVEVMLVSKQLGASSFSMSESLLVAGSVYLVFTSIAVIIFNHIEKRMEKY